MPAGHPDFQGFLVRRSGDRALVGVVDLSQTKLNRVEANIQPGNLASRALVERLSFRLEGFPTAA